MLEQFIAAILYFTNPLFLAGTLVGSLLGLIVGIIPGISGLLAMACFLPFAFGQPPELALSFMVAVTSTQFTGGSISAVLLGIPGTGPNAATVIDGYPMTQKGEGGRALGAALTASTAGGLLSPLLALAMIPAVLPIINAVKTADMVFIILLGLVCIGIVSRGSLHKGLISGGLGLLVSFIGFQTVTGVPRFTFGSLYLYDGLPLIPVALGLFAIPEVISLAVKGGTISARGRVTTDFKQILEGIIDVIRHWQLWLRSTLIGFIVGVIPGVGADVAVFVAYGQAVRTSKHSKEFGTGVVEGVIAPESANNAKEGGSLLTTLALGIPGSATGAVLLGAMLMVGLIPGPEMMSKHLDLSLSLIMASAAGCILGGIICLPTAKYLARVSSISSSILVPMVLAIIASGAFTYRQELLDLFVVAGMGIVGLVMKLYGFNRPALFLGFILGFIFEQNLFIALAIYGPLFFLSPLSLIIITIIIGLFTAVPIKNVIQARLRKDSHA